MMVEKLATVFTGLVSIMFPGKDVAETMQVLFDEGIRSIEDSNRKAEEANGKRDSEEGS